tara:strand:- start:2160 stop:2543 length:384 start_codon:yes stop_codon:yes gene_type:complete
MDDRYIEAAVNSIQPVLEGSILLAAGYSKKCGRDFVTATDFDYALKYATRNLIGKHTGTLFPELDSDDDPDDIELVEETEDSFTRYDGPDELMNRVNECYDTWDQWEPDSILEKMMCDSIKKNSRKF